MKIGMVSKYPEEQDGTAIYAENLCRELKKVGIEAVKIGDRNSTTADYRVNFKSPFLKWQLQKIIENAKIDLLHFQYVPNYFVKLMLNLNLLLALNQKVPVVVTFQQFHTDTSSLKGKVMNLIQKLVARRADAAITLLRQQKELLQLNYRKKQAYFVRMGLTPEQMHKLKGRNVLFFGMLDYSKGVEYLIRAMNELPNFRLTIAGKAANNDYERLIRAATAENKHGNVKLDIRWVPEDEKKKYLEEADIMAFPYISALSQPAAISDAFAYGVPVVVTDADFIGDDAKGFVFGRVVEQRSPKALAAGVKAVYGNYETYQRGVRKYREVADWERVAEQHAVIYDETLQEYYELHGVVEKERKEKEKLAEMSAEDSDDLETV